MKTVRCLLVAAVVATLQFFASAGMPGWCNTFNDGTRTWVWGWTTDAAGNDAVRLTGYWDDDAGDVVAGVSPSPEGKVEIPATVRAGLLEREVKVVELDYNLFYNCSNVTEVVIPDSIERIGGGVFYGCSALEKVNAPASLFAVDGGAFDDTKWMEQQEDDFVTFGGKFLLRYMGDDAEVVIPETVEVICNDAFDGNDSLETVTIPGGVVEIDEYAFYGCTALVEVNGATNVMKVGCCAFEDSKIWEDAPENSFVRVADMLVGFKGDKDALEGEVDVDDGVTVIADACFEDCAYVTVVNLPDSLCAIGDYAFRNCVALEEFAIPDGVTALGECFLDGCESLTDLYIGDGVVDVKDIGFLENLESVYFGDGVETIGPSAFQYCEYLEDVWFGASLVSIGERAFECCALTSVTIPESVEVIGNGAFADCESLEEVDFEGDMSQIAMNVISAFADTPWLEEYLSAPPDNDYFAASEVIEGESGVVLGKTTGATLEDGESEEYYDGWGVDATVWYQWTAPTNGTFSFETLDADFVNVIGVYRGDDIDDLEMLALSFGGYESRVAIDAEEGETYYIAVGGFEIIDELGTFRLAWNEYEWDIEFEIDEDGLLTGVDSEIMPSTLTIPEGVTAIDGWLGPNNGLQNVRTVVLPSTMKYVGESAFQNCWGLRDVVGLTDEVCVEPRAFFCTPFDEEVPFRVCTNYDGVVTGFIGQCPKSVEIPLGVVGIDNSAFYRDAYSVAAYDENDEWIDYSCLDDLESVTIPPSVEDVCDYAFAGCTNLSYVKLGNPDVVIDGSAFHGCEDLAGFEIEKNGFLFIGYELYRTSNPVEYDQEKDEWVEVVPDFLPVGETLVIEDIDMLINGRLTGAMITNDVYDIYGDVIGEEIKPEVDDLAGVCVRAVWEKVDTPPPEIFSPENAAARNSAFVGAAQYMGWLRGADGQIAGSITLKAGKPGKDGKAKITATVVMLADGKKQTFKGVAQGNGGVAKDVSLTGGTGAFTVSLSGDAVTGSFAGNEVSAAQNVFASNDAEDKAAASAVQKGTWIVSFASARGYVTLSLAVAAKGKVKVAGMLPDGSKVSVSTQAIVGDGGRWCVPVAYAKKGARLGFVAWFETTAGGSAALREVSDLTPLVSTKGQVTALQVVDEACGTAGTLSAGEHVFSLEEGDVAALGIPATLADLLPTNEEVTVAGGKWNTLKPAKVAYKNGVLVVTPAKGVAGVANASGLKFKFKAKDSSFSGSFTVYSLNGSKLAKTKFTVTGSVVNGAGYGMAYNKKIGSMPVVVK